MAETVRHFLEEMVPELEDLEEKGYFSKQELREIVRKRENFEYALKRRPPLKADFLRYIEYEGGLSELLQLRKSVLGSDEKPGRGDIGMISRCHFLFERATRKFRGDLRLWVGWLDFCEKTDSTRQLSKVMTKALQFHPTASGLWSRAAAWEFGRNRDTAAARKLMQQALRICPVDEQLWLELLRLELVYALKLRTRRKILGIQPQAGQKRKLEEVDATEPVGEDTGSALDAVLSGAVAKLVAKEAVARIPSSLKFRLSILDTLEGTSFPGTEAIAEEIMAGIEADFRASEEAWAVRARRASGASASSSEKAGFEAAVRVFEDGLQQLPTATMIDHYAAFLFQQVSEDGLGAGEGNAAAILKGRQKRIAKQALELLQRASGSGWLSEQTALAWPKLALQCGRVTKALEAAEAGTRHHPASAQLWRQRITLLAQQAASQEGLEREKSTAEITKLTLAAADAVERDSAPEVWELGFETLKQLAAPVQDLLPRLKLWLAAGRKAPAEASLGHVCAEAVRMVREEQGLQQARAFYSSLLALPGCGSEFFHRILDMELAEVEQPLQRQRLKFIFESAVEVYGQEDVRLWLRYARFEQAEGRGSGSVYWKATRTLADPEPFITGMS